MLNNVRIGKTISTPIWATNFFWRFQLCQMLDIVLCQNLEQYQEKLIMQPRENGNPNFGPNLGLQFFCPQALPSISRNCSKLSPYAISRKTNKLEKMGKKIVSGLILVPLGQIWAPKFLLWILTVLDVRHCCKLSFYAISRKTNEPNLRKQQKTQFCRDFVLYQPKFGPQKYFLQVLPLLDVKHYCQLSLYTISRKTNEPNLRKQQKKPSFKPDVGPFGLPIFVSKIWLHQSLHS